MKPKSKILGVAFIVIGLVIAGPTIIFLGLKALAGINNIIVANLRGGTGYTYSIHLLVSSCNPDSFTYLFVSGLLGAILIFTGIQQLKKNA